MLYLFNGMLKRLSGVCIIGSMGWHIDVFDHLVQAMKQCLRPWPENECAVKEQTFIATRLSSMRENSLRNKRSMLQVS